MPLEKDGAGHRQTINVSLVKDKKASEHHMVKQVFHSSFIAKTGNMKVVFIQLELSRSYIEMEDMANPLQSVSFGPISPLQQTNGYKLNFLNVVKGKVNLDVKAGHTTN